MAKRRVQTRPVRNPVTGKWRLSALPVTERSYLGGLTLPYLTRRPHMGPFNRVTDSKISDADEVYRKHDKGYASEIARGRNPYTQWNKYDQALMDAPSTGWPDYVAKAAFGVKKFFTHGLPEAKKPQFKAVSSIALPKDGSRPGKGIRDYMSNPTIPKGGFTTVQENSSGQITGTESGPRNFWRGRAWDKLPQSQQGHSWGTKIRYEY